MLRTDTRVQFPRIFHPSDFSDASNVAFAHALKLAVAGKSSLTVLHTGATRSDDTWAEFPRVRRTLERWKLLPPDSPKEAICGLGLDVEKVALPHSDPARSIVHYLARHPHDLIVLATHQHDGFERWTHEQVAEPIARNSAEMTLFIPHGIEGFVSDADGGSTLRNILIPVDRIPDPQIAIDGATAIAGGLVCHDAAATLLHVGEETLSPEVLLPGRMGLQWRRIYRQGNVEQQILQAADECHADLIVMATRGHHRFLDALRGSTTERIVRNSRCPVLAVPAYRAAEPVNATVEGLATGALAVGI